MNSTASYNTIMMKTNSLCIIRSSTNSTNSVAYLLEKGQLPIQPFVITGEL